MSIGIGSSWSEQSDYSDFEEENYNSKKLLKEVLAMLNSVPNYNYGEGKESNLLAKKIEDHLKK